MYLLITICLSCFNIDQVSPDIGLLFLITKYGYLYLCDLESCACLCSTRISTSIIFSSTLNSTTHGILGVTRSGQVRNLINQSIKGWKFLKAKQFQLWLNMYIDHFHEIIDCIFGYSLIICFSQFLLTLPQK